MRRAAHESRGSSVVRAFLAFGVASACVSVADSASAGSPILELGRAPKVDIPRARELDAAGVRAYREGRYREAMLLFTEAYRVGGPSLELWNVARCHQRLDEGDEAAQVLTRYLEATDLYPRDRADATRELHELKRRASPLIVDVGATGAFVYVDGRRVGQAPLVTDVAPGHHVVRVELDSAVREYELEARNGRPLVVRVTGETTSVSSDVEEPASPPVRRKVELDLQGGLYAHKLGAVFGRVGPSIALGTRVGIGRAPLSGFLGLRGEFYSTGWSREEPDPPTGGCVLPDRFRATAVAGLAGGGFTWEATSLVRTTLELGGGIETLFAERGGGDVLLPTCSPSPGLVPLLAARAEVSFRLARTSRIVLTPFAFAIHPAYEGARNAPHDATGAWLRMGASLGISYDVGM